MKKFFACMLCIMVCTAILSYSVAGGFINDADAIENAAKSVLKLFSFAGTTETNLLGTGSGFVAFNNYTLITNYHVMKDAAIIIATDDENQSYVIDKVICADEKFDIAILEFEKATNLQPLKLYPDDQLKRGSPVVAIGSPKEMKNVVSTGIVSYQYADDGVPLIQITAPISPGSSGGALFNDEGQVIGVTTETYKIVDENGEFTYAQNLNFAVNISVAQAMYNAWDGTKYTFENYKSSAKMDFTGVYKHEDSALNKPENVSESSVESPTESWICLNCGKENNTKFCLDCGVEKPYWICACGRINNSNKFCGDCGRNYVELIDIFNSAVQDEKSHQYSNALEKLEELGAFDSGTFETSEGSHTEAKHYLLKTYYDQALYLQSSGGDHQAIVDSLIKAGEYGDAKQQIEGENARYGRLLYNEGVEQRDKGEYDAAIVSFTEARDYIDIGTAIPETYYQKGLSLLNRKEYAESRKAFEQAGEYNDAQTMISRSYYDEAEQDILQKKYDEALKSFAKAGDYGDAKERIQDIYYIQGIECLSNGDSEKAKSFFYKAGDYKDAKEQIDQIIEADKAETYGEAISLFEKQDYEKAFELFRTIPGYRDADDLKVQAKVLDIQQKYKALEIDLEKIAYNQLKICRILLGDLKQYKNTEQGEILYKEIYYALGYYYVGINTYETAIESFHEASGYLDASEKETECKIKRYNQLIQQGREKEADNFFQKELVSLGQIEEYVMMEPGTKGKIVTEVTALFKPLGINTRTEENEKEYKDTYVPAVQKVEEHFGMNGDGKITLSEYAIIRNAVYPGSKATNVKGLLEKLADLSYINNLSKDHSAYETKYTNAIKKAEKEMGLLADGIVTQAEYDTIMNKHVDMPARPDKFTVNIKNDTVTLTWSKVPGAISYDVYKDSKLLGTTEKTTWTEKNVQTGVTVVYKVRAKKYTVNGTEKVEKVKIEKYYAPVSVSELTKNMGIYTGKYVKINNLKIAGWWVHSPNGKFSDDSTAIKNAQTKDDYDIFFLCYTGASYIEIVLKDYKSWNWTSSDDLLSRMNRISSISITGTAGKPLASWEQHPNIPSVVINEISWRYK